MNHPSTRPLPDIPRVGLGTSGEQDVGKLSIAVYAALECGYRLFDTAVVYGNHEALGVALKAAMAAAGVPREEIFISTKMYLTKENCDLHIIDAVLKSLQDLDMAYLDVVFIHYPTYDSGAEEALQYPDNQKIRRLGYDTLRTLQQRGLIRFVGVSNYEVRHLDELSDNLPDILQVEQHPRFVREDLREYCRQNNIFFQAFASLAGKDFDFTTPSVVAASERLGISPRSVLLQWGLSNADGIIPKSVNPARIHSNFEETKQENLTPSEVAEISKENKGIEGCVIKRCRGWMVL